LFTRSLSMSKMKSTIAVAFAAALLTAFVSGFTVPQSSVKLSSGRLNLPLPQHFESSTSLNERISDERRKKLGLPDDADEYDSGVALENSTDPLISKIIAGSLILTIFALLAVGVILPSLTDYGEGVCNPILTAGRC
jgi:hypothetical protein